MDIFSGGFFSSKSKAPHQHMDYKPNPIRHPKNEGTMKVMYKVMIWTLFVPILSLMLIFILLLVRRYLRLREGPFSGVSIQPRPQPRTAPLSPAQLRTAPHSPAGAPLAAPHSPAQKN